MLDKSDIRQAPNAESKQDDWNSRVIVSDSKVEILWHLTREIFPEVHEIRQSSLGVEVGGY